MTTDEMKAILERKGCKLEYCPFLTGASPDVDCFTCEGEVPE